MKDLILDDDIKLPKASTAESAKEIMSLKTKHAELHKKVRHGKIALWVLIAYCLLGIIVETIQTEGDLVVLAVNGTYAGLLIVCALIVEMKKPFFGLLGALIIFLLINIIIIFGDPMYLLRGIIIKAAIVYYLIIGITSIKEYLRVLKDLKAHGLEVEGSELI